MSRHDWAAAPLPALRFPISHTRSFRTDGLDRATPPWAGPREGSDAPGFLIAGHRGVERESGHTVPRIILFRFAPLHARVHLRLQAAIITHTQHTRSGGGAVTSTSAERRRARGCPGRGGLQGLLFLGGVPSCQAKVSLVLSPSRHSFCFSVVK